MELSKISEHGQATIPKAIRDAAGLRAGDLIVFEIEGDRIVVRKAVPERDDYLDGLSDTMSEWASPEDEAAWRDL